MWVGRFLHNYGQFSNTNIDDSILSDEAFFPFEKLKREPDICMYIARRFSVHLYSVAYVSLVCLCAFVRYRDKLGDK